MALIANCFRLVVRGLGINERRIVRSGRRCGGVGFWLVSFTTTVGRLCFKRKVFMCVSFIHKIVSIESGGQRSLNLSEVRMGIVVSSFLLKFKFIVSYL